MHLTYCLAHNLMACIRQEHQIDLEANGAVDSDQLLIWSVNDEEILRSHGGVVTATAKFTELAKQVINKRFPQDDKNI